MRLSQAFDDLSEFVATYRGRISREGILLHTDTLYEEGTVLGIEITLTESLSLVRGTAGVVQLLKDRPETDKSYSAVLEFLQLDEDSEAFLSRLTERFEAEGAEPFCLDQYVVQGRRGIRRQSGSFRVVDVPMMADQSAGVVVESEHFDASAEETADADRRSAKRKRSRSRSWGRWGLAFATAAAVLATAAVVAYQVLPGLSPSSAAHPPPMMSTQASSIESDDHAVRHSPSSATMDHEEPVPNFEDPPQPNANISGLPAATRLEAIDWHEAGTYTVVTMVADGSLDETTVRHYRMNEDGQSKMVLYLLGIGPGGISYKTRVDGRQLAAVRVWFHEDESPVQLHIVLDLAGQDVVAFKPVVEGHRLLVTLGPRE